MLDEIQIIFLFLIKKIFLNQLKFKQNQYDKHDLEASKYKWVNSLLDIGVNWLKLGDLHLSKYITN